MTTSVSVGEHFKRLFDFSGREDRASFWPYAAIAFCIVMVIGMVIFIPIMMQAMEGMQRFAAENPDQATISSGPGHYSISVRGERPRFISAGAMGLYLGVTFGSAILLYAAAVVRRLRDAGLSGLWGLLPLPFIAYSSVQMPRLFGSVGRAEGPDMALFFSVFISNFLYIGSLIVLIILLAKRSKLEA